LYNNSVQRLLLECDKLAQEISKEILDVVESTNTNGLKIQSHGRSIHIPQIMRLESRIEQFLYSAKSMLRDLTKIFDLFFEKKFTEARYDKVLTWAIHEFGSESELAQIIDYDHEAWIKKLISMRNAIEHPGGYSGHLNICNFELVTSVQSEAKKLQEPCWYLNEEKKASIGTDLLTLSSNMLEFAEDILVICIKMKGFPDMLKIVEIPENQRENNALKRLRVIANMDNI